MKWYLFDMVQSIFVSEAQSIEACMPHVYGPIIPIPQPAARIIQEYDGLERVRHMTRLGTGTLMFQRVEHLPDSHPLIGLYTACLAMTLLPHHPLSYFTDELGIALEVEFKDNTYNIMTMEGSSQINVSAERTPTVKAMLLIRAIKGDDDATQD